MYIHPSQSLYPVGPSGPDADTFCRNEEEASPSLRSTAPLGVPTIKDKITSMMGIEHLRCHMASAWIGLSLTFPKTYRISQGIKQ